MKRTLVILGFLTIGGLIQACSNMVETSTSRNMNPNDPPSNVGVVTNDNGNQNTAGVRPINANANANRP